MLEQNWQGVWPDFWEVLEVTLASAEIRGSCRCLHHRAWQSKKCSLPALPGFQECEEAAAKQTATESSAGCVPGFSLAQIWKVEIENLGNCDASREH